MNRGTTSSARLTSSGVVKAAGDRVDLQALVVNPSGSAGTVTLYEGVDTDGDVRFYLDTPAGGVPIVVPFDGGLTFRAGLHVELSNCEVSLSYW